MDVATPGDCATASLKIRGMEIDAFADLTGDDNPIHLDSEYAQQVGASRLVEANGTAGAAAGPFDGRVAHGMLTASVISSAVAKLPGDIVYLSQDLTFEGPVYAGETVTATVSVTESLGEDHRRLHTTAAVDDTTVVSGEAVVLTYPSR